MLTQLKTFYYFYETEILNTSVTSTNTDDTNNDTIAID